MHASRTILASVALASLAACDNGRRPFVGSATAASSPAVQLAGRPEPAVAPPDSISDDAWVASADSALRRALSTNLFGGDRGEARKLHQCDDDRGEDQPMMMIAVRARLLGHRAATADIDAAPVSTEFRGISFRVELTSVAQLTPAYDADVRDFKGVPIDDAWVAAIAVRTDTLDLLVRDYGTPRRRWALCDFSGSVRGATSLYWDLLPDSSARVLRWTPADGSWARVRSLADSVRAATHWSPAPALSRPVAAAPLVSGPDSTPRDPWIASADSALRTLLPGSLFGGNPDAVTNVRECPGEGADDPPMLMAAVRAHPVSHDTVITGLDVDEPEAKQVVFHVELTSVAQLAYGREAGIPSADLRASAAEGRDAYVAVLDARVDTLEFGVRDYGTRLRRWALCDIGGSVRGTTHTWMLLAREPQWVKVVRWSPADGSWDRVRAAADSVRSKLP